MLLLEEGKSMMEPGLQELLLDSLFTYSLLILGSFLSVFPEQTVNLLHEFSTIIPAVKLRDILAVQIYRLYGVILIGLSSFTMFRVYSLSCEKFTLRGCLRSSRLRLIPRKLWTRLNSRRQVTKSESW
jgi:hypothetical protein